jgi:hypothetical protein
MQTRTPSSKWQENGTILEREGNKFHVLGRNLQGGQFKDMNRNMPVGDPTDLTINLSPKNVVDASLEFAYNRIQMV